jgi:hypothetical protein
VDRGSDHHSNQGQLKLKQFQLFDKHGCCQRWIKLHAQVGTATHVITSVEVTRARSAMR